MKKITLNCNKASRFFNPFFIYFQHISGSSVIYYHFNAWHQWCNEIYTSIQHRPFFLVIDLNTFNTKSQSSKENCYDWDLSIHWSWGSVDFSNGLCQLYLSHVVFQNSKEKGKTQTLELDLIYINPLCWSELSRETEWEKEREREGRREGDRDREIGVLLKMVHMVMKSGKSHNLLFITWRTRKVGGLIQPNSD